jgi:hypothetical protein
MGRSLTPLPGRQDLVLAPAPADLVLAPAPAALVLVGQGDRVELMGLVALTRRLALVLPHLVDQAGPVELVLAGQGDRVERGPVDRELPDLMGRADLASQVVLVAMGPVDLAAPVDRAALVDLVQTGPANRVGLMSPVGLEAPADQEAPVGPDLTARAAQVDRHRRRTSNTVSTIGVARNGVAPGTLRTDSARPITARLHRRRNAASGGTMGLRLEVRRPTGTARRLLAVGMGRHLLAAGTVDGTGRVAT